MKIVIDTNVIASAIFFDGKPDQLIRLLMEGRLDACVSPEIIEEYQGIKIVTVADFFRNFWKES